MSDDLEEMLHELMVAESMIETRYPTDSEPVEMVAESYVQDVLPGMARGMSDWLKAHDAKVAATALNEAADALPFIGGTQITRQQSAAYWLRERAAEYRTLAGHGTPEATTRPKAGDRFMNGDEPGVLVTCPQCDGDGTLHKADRTPESPLRCTTEPALKTEWWLTNK